MPDRGDALDDAYGRLAATRLTGPSGSAEPVGVGRRPGGAPSSPRSLLLSRLALLRPRAHVRAPRWHGGTSDGTA